MKKIAALLVLVFAVAACASIAISATEPTSRPHSTMLSFLRLGQQVQIFSSESYTYIVTIVNERAKQNAAFQQSSTNERAINGKIIGLGADYIVVSDDKNDFERTIAASAIHAINQFPNEKSAESAKSDK